MSTHLVRSAALAVIAASVLANVGCGQTHAKVAFVNVEVLQSTWPKFINYQNQLQATLYAIQSSKLRPAEKQKQLQQLNQQSARWQAEVTNDVKDAVKQIASTRHYELVVTRQGTAYGGDDITSDVQSALRIPLATPSPGR
jgi:Skp family chaperone for outer membrane proteins